MPGWEETVKIKDVRLFRIICHGMPCHELRYVPLSLSVSLFFLTPIFLLYSASKEEYSNFVQQEEPKAE
jgi:hypothetical protein